MNAKNNNDVMTRKKCLSLLGIKSSTIKPVTGHYTDWDIPAHKETCSMNQVYDPRDSIPLDKYHKASDRLFLPFSG
jgi:hypothetical protein